MVLGGARRLPASSIAGSTAQFSGHGFIAGLVTVAGSPAMQKVLCFDKLTDRCIAATISSEDGRYRFDHLNPDREFYVIAFDGPDRFNAVIRDQIKPASDEV